MQEYERSRNRMEVRGCGDARTRKIIGVKVCIDELSG